MSLKTPTVEEINENLIAQLTIELNEAIPLLPKAFLRVLAKAIAAVFILLYKYAGFIFLQMFVQHATIKVVSILGREFSPLKEWGRLIDVGDPAEATQAQVEISITVHTQGGVLEAGSTQFVSSETGVTYLLVAAVLLDSPTVLGVIRAAGDQGGGNGAGAIGNLQVGDPIQFANPVSEVERTATVTAQIVTGADEEDSELYRSRIIERFQKRPAGGALIDYEIWAEEVPGIVNVYPYTGAQAGNVDVYVEASPESSGNPDGIPTQAQLDAVAASIELDENGLASRRQANAFVNVYPITRAGFDVLVSGLAVSNEAQVRGDIDDALAEYFAQREPYVSGVTQPPRTDTLTRSALIGLVEDIVTAANGTFSTVDFELSSGSGTLFTYALMVGEKAKLTPPVIYS